jgi:FlaA1/EpsC-like NDP-sugar epimerase
VVRIFDNNEPSLSRLKADLDDTRCRYLVGDVRDKDRLARAMEDIDVVIHSAAMKHVDLSEYNPFEAVKTNVMGLQNVVDTAIDSTVKRLVYTSSDKAVNPANTMGTTKLLGEKLVTAGNKHRGRGDLHLASVRFGNVINSSRSVIPVFHRQIRKGGPVTLTDERMTRFFLSYTDLVELVTKAIEKTNGGEVFVYKMPALRIQDLAEVMIEVLAPGYGHDPDRIGVEIVGRRLGETLHEEIMTEREAERALENDRLHAIPPETAEGNGYLRHDGIEGFEESEQVVRSSEHAEWLERHEIRELLDDNGALTPSDGR